MIGIKVLVEVTVWEKVRYGDGLVHRLARKMKSTDRLSSPSPYRRFLIILTLSLVFNNGRVTPFIQV